MKTRTASILITLTGMAAATLALAGAPAAAASDPTLTGTSVTINSGPGNSTDPHVSGDWVSYTNDSTGSDEIHYYNLATSTDAYISNNGGNDTLSDVSGTTLVYTHEDTSGNFYIDAFDIGSGNPPAVVDPVTGSVRSDPAIGGDTVAWVDYTNNPAAPEIIVYNTVTQTATVLANNGYPNLEPAVSPDGSVVTWVQCSSAGVPCEVWDAIQGSGGTWTSNQLTDSASGDSENPHTDGTIVTYSSLRSGAEAIYYQPVGGGTEQEVPLPAAGSNCFNPHASGGLISFECVDSSGNSNIYVYSLATQAVYQVTNTGTATLDDISVTGGTAAVVWQALVSGQYNVYGFIFAVPQAALSVTTTSLPGATLGAGYSAALAATGGTAPYTWSVTSGSLPPGLSLNASTGVISGAPVLAGTFGFTVQATDSSSPTPQTASATLSVTVGGCATTITGTYNGPLTIGAGVTCLEQATVSGPVKITAGAVVSVQGSTLRGPLTATGAASLAVCGSAVSGPASVSGATGPVLLGGASGSPCAVDTISGPVTLSGDAGGVTLAGATVSGPATVSGNGGGVTLSGNSIGGPASITGNTGGTLVAGNTISGPLSCSGNNPAPTDGGQPNTVKGPATGQCSALA
jgi:Tol biopolymer transport system component